MLDVYFILNKLYGDMLKVLVYQLRVQRFFIKHIKLKKNNFLFYDINNNYKFIKKKIINYKKKISEFINL